MGEYTRSRAAIIAGMSIMGAIAACYSIDSKPVRASAKGEGCQSSDECESGLSCVPSGGGGLGVCALNKFNVAVTGKSCEFVQCRTTEDCCANVFGDAASCTSRVQCSEDKCVTKCTQDIECGGGAAKCTGGKCVQCTKDTDCGNERCSDGQCQPKCTSDSQCPGFNRCTDGACVKSGCQADRECIAATGNVEATCGTDGGCQLACRSDIECGNPKSFKFFSCVDGNCTDVGCESDKDCQLRASGGGAPPGGGNIAACK
jgi:hypothetical protein